MFETIDNKTKAELDRKAHAQITIRPRDCYNEEFPEFVAFLFVAGCCIGFVYVVLHFIMKYW